MNSPSAVESIFFAALGRGSPEERAAYLDGACADDDDLRRRVERLLKAQPNVGEFMQNPAAGGLGTVDEPVVTERPGTVIGPYKLLEQIGEGGMGLVFVAEQDQPLRRRVALKVIKPGMDTREVVARFEAERQALALMDHPNIAKVLDAGATEAGRPFFVMELVRGVAITKFCDENRLTPRERLELFVPVCAAVQHAHQKGIIHRDLKPSNVLVTLHDGRPVPKVIDFGVAKAVGHRLTERTVYTRFLQMVGTPLYMSPEQAEMSGLDIDTRSDIYSLGVLLYELLTGTTPFDKQRLGTAAFDEVRRIIREEEPPKPSTRVSKLGDTLTAVSSRRKTEPAKLSRLMRGELDWIVMKALEKDRSRRYETANGFARDVQRYLADEPVEACPPSAAYRLRKFTRKHRAGLAVGVGFAALLLLGGVVSAWQAVRAMQARDAEAAERQAAVEQRDRAMKAEEQSQAVLKFFQEKVLAAGRPEGQEGGLGREATIRAAVESAEPEIGTAFADQPVVEAAIRFTLGITYWYLSEPTVAIRQHERALALRRQALGPEHPDTLTSLNELAESYRIAYRFKEATDLHEETLRLRQKVLGVDHLDTLNSMNNVGLMYQETGRWEEALRLHEQTLNLRQRKLGRNHTDTLCSMHNLAVTYSGMDRRHDAIKLEEQALAVERVTFGSGDMRTLVTMHNLAIDYANAGRVADALALANECLRLAEAKLGPSHLDTLHARDCLAIAHRAGGQVADGLTLFAENHSLARDRLGPEHPFTLYSADRVAWCHLDLGNTAQAQAIFFDVLRFKPKLSADPRELASALSGLGWALLRQNREADAEPYLRDCLDVYQKAAPDGWRYFSTQSLLGASLLGQKRFSEAEPLLLAGCEGLWQREAKIERQFTSRLTEAVERLVLLYEATGKADEAAKWRAKLPPKDAK